MTETVIDNAKVLQLNEGSYPPVNNINHENMCDTGQCASEISFVSCNLLSNRLKHLQLSTSTPGSHLPKW